MERPSVKPITPASIPSKTYIISWLRKILPDLAPTARIEDFGDGVVYCRILHHYYGSPALQKINWHPKNEYEYMNNLKNVQATVLQHGLTIPFDVNKICKKKFLENWQLINIFYKLINGATDLLPINEAADENSLAGSNLAFHAQAMIKSGKVSVGKNFPFSRNLAREREETRNN